MEDVSLSSIHREMEDAHPPFAWQASMWIRERQGALSLTGLGRLIIFLNNIERMGQENVPWHGYRCTSKTQERPCANGVTSWRIASRSPWRSPVDEEGEAWHDELRDLKTNLEDRSLQLPFCLFHVNFTAFCSWPFGVLHLYRVLGTVKVGVSSEL